MLQQKKKKVTLHIKKLKNKEEIANSVQSLDIARS